MREGKPIIQYKYLYGYKKGIDGNPEIVPEQAEVVQKIYDKFLAGYLNEEPTEIEGLNKTALDLIVDVDTLESRSDWKVGTWDGVQGELNGLTYLCWTVSPKFSCVMGYTARTVAEDDIFHMAESVEQSE